MKLLTHNICETTPDNLFISGNSNNTDIIRKDHKINLSTQPTQGTFDIYCVKWNQKTCFYSVHMTPDFHSYFVCPESEWQVL